MTLPVSSLPRLLYTILVFPIIILAFIALYFLFAKAPASAAVNGYFHTDGNKIVDSGNVQVRITGVNWFGMETDTFVPHGLWSRNYKEMIVQMRDAGFNTIRLPFSNQIFDSNSTPNGIDWGKNPDLQSLSALELMDKVVAYAGETGMKVILDRHRPDAYNQSALWYTGSYSEERWIEDWKTLARRYKNNSTVIGVDLHNEPHDNACWGCGNISTDWRLAAERAGNAVLKENPNLLIIVEGVQVHNDDYYWWGGNLAGVKDHPIRLSVPNKLVYSPHDYPESVWTQPWFYEANFPNNLTAKWDKEWGYIHKNNIAPILIGEFGTKLETTKDKQWLDHLVAYISDNNISWVYWSWNPNSSDTGGILQADWRTLQSAKLEALRPIQAPLVSGSPTPPVPQEIIPVSPSPAPAVTPLLSALPSPLQPTQGTTSSSPTPQPSGALVCAVRYEKTNQWNNGFVVHLSVHNAGDAVVDGWTLVWNFSGNQRVVSAWNGELHQEGANVQLKSLGWNAELRPGKVVTLGFVGSYLDENVQPNEITLNGQRCTLIN